MHVGPFTEISPYYHMLDLRENIVVRFKTDIQCGFNVGDDCETVSINVLMTIGNQTRFSTAAGRFYTKQPQQLETTGTKRNVNDTS